MPADLRFLISCLFFLPPLLLSSLSGNLIWSTIMHIHTYTHTWHNVKRSLCLSHLCLILRTQLRHITRKDSTQKATTKIYLSFFFFCWTISTREICIWLVFYVCYFIIFSRFIRKKAATATRNKNVQHIAIFVYSICVYYFFYIFSCYHYTSAHKLCISYIFFIF